MTEALDFSSPDTAPAGADATTPEPSAVQAGAALRRAREGKGVHLVALASALKVPTKHLESLEAGAFDALPDLVFAKALAASVCRHMGVDTAEVMQWWPVVNNPTLAKSTSGGPVKPTVFDPYPDRPRPLRRVVLSLGLLAIVAGLVWVWLTPAPAPDAPVSESQSVAPDAAATPVDAAVVVPAAALQSGTETAAAADAAPATNEPSVATTAATEAVTVGASSAAAVVAVAASKPAASAPTELATPVVATPVAPVTPVQPGDAGGLALRVQTASWIEVRNARDGVLASRVVQAGETLQWPLSGGPWSVILGNAQGVQVKVNGHVRDLAADTRANVARFSLE